jgi:hypothetical protein
MGQREIKSLLGLGVVGLLSLCLAACGADGSGSDSTSGSSSAGRTATTSVSNVAPAPAQTKADADKDNDIGAPEDDTNNDSTLSFGHPASTSDTRAITTLIKRYYAAADAENGPEACSLLYSSLEEEVPEDYGQSPPGPPYMHGTTCAASMTLLFKHFHPQISVELPKLTVARVRLIEHHGIVILHFGTLPERQIAVHREGHTWKVSSIFDGEVP